MSSSDDSFMTKIDKNLRLNAFRQLDIDLSDVEWHRFWDEQSVQLDGTFTLNQLRAFVLTLERMQVVRRMSAQT
jgi:hypothetical protein